MFDLTRKIAGVCLWGVSSFAAASAEDLGPTLEKIKQSGTITIGHRDNVVPMSYFDAQQKPVGFSIDLCGSVVDSIKQKLGLAELKVSYRAVTPANSASLVHDGAVDLECGATPISAEVQQQAAESLPIYASELKWIVPKRLRVETEGRRRRSETRTASSVDDLRNKTVVLMRGSAAMPIVLTISSDRSLGLSILNAKDPASGFKLVESGQASAFLEDSLTLMTLKANAKNPEAFGFLDDSYSGGAFYSLLMRKDDRPFKGLVDRAIADSMKSGEYAKLHSKWLESPIPPKNVNLSYPMPERLRQLIKQPANQALANSQN